MTLLLFRFTIHVAEYKENSVSGDLPESKSHSFTAIF
jgi:hypothetical protein